MDITFFVFLFVVVVSLFIAVHTDSDIDSDDVVSYNLAKLSDRQLKVLWFNVYSEIINRRELKEFFEKH